MYPCAHTGKKRHIKHMLRIKRKQRNMKSIRFVFVSIHTVNDHTRESISLNVLLSGMNKWI